MAVTAGERRLVSVLVADIAGSTTIGEQLGPERSKFLFDEIAVLMREQVERFGGTVAQLTGDGLFAVFGAPVGHEDDSARAVRAGLAIHEALRGYANEVEEAYGIELAARVGINTGPVVVPAMDAAADVLYNALGDTVNVAARLQTFAGTGGVAIGPGTARQVEAQFELEPLGELELKGKSAPVAAFRVKGSREVVTSRRGSLLVGRESELEVLHETLESLLDGRGGLVSITGEPGIGKSRLVAEVRERYRDRACFLEGQGVSYAETFPYWPIRELLRGWLGLGAAAPEARTRLELKAGLARVLGAEADGVYPLLATLLGLSLEPDATERVRELSRDSVREQTIDSVYRLVCALAQQEPVCVVLDDLHWADDSTIELLEELLAITDEEAVALILLYRAEREHRSWRLGERARQRFPHRHHELQLEALASDASHRLAGAAAGAPLPEAVAELLAERAGGNPFFLEEALRDLVERGAIRRANGRFELAVGIAELSIPTVVHEALQARLDRLGHEARETLAVAAVIGRRFGAPLLERIVPRERMLPALSELQRLELVVEERRRPAPEYRFRHGLVQEVAYAGLLEARRRELHHDVGCALEEIHRDAPEQAFELLARHFSEADEPERAVRYLLKAGDGARALYANEEALDRYGKALAFMERTGDDAGARETLFKIGLTHHLAFDFKGAGRAYRDAFSLPADEHSAPVPTERLETATEMVEREFVPGHAYMSNSVWLAGHLFRPLLRIDQELNVLPEVAESFDVSADGTTYRFRIGVDARWSDGHPLDAHDFVFAWRKMREDGVPSAALLEDIEEARAVDDRTLELRLRAPRSYFLYVIGGLWFCPWPRHKYEELGERWREPEQLVGNGPFVLAELDDEHALLRANPLWARRRGNVGVVHISFVTGDEEQASAWRSGRYDVLVLGGPPELAEAESTVVEIVPLLASAWTAFRPDVPPFDDPLVRRAFSHALDRSRPVDGLPDVARPAGRGGVLPPSMPGHSHRVGAEFDLDEARRLLAEAGYPEGRDLPEICIVLPDYTGGGRPEAVAANLVEQWSALGARVRARIVAHHEFWRVLDAEGQAWIQGWNADYPDPDGFFRGMREGLPLYWDDQLEELVRRAGSLRNQDERMELYRELERLWIGEHAALVPLVYLRQLLVRRPWIHGALSSTFWQMGQLDEVVVRR